MQVDILVPQLVATQAVVPTVVSDLVVLVPMVASELVPPVPHHRNTVPHLAVSAVLARVDSAVPARVDSVVPAKVDSVVPARVDSVVQARVDSALSSPTSEQPLLVNTWLPMLAVLLVTETSMPSLVTVIKFLYDYV